jgi:hypothetical protein
MAAITLRVTCDMSEFQAQIRGALFAMWCVQHGDVYNRATCRVVTAI